jgi:hypothetical protein
MIVVSPGRDWLKGDGFHCYFQPVVILIGPAFRKKGGSRFDEISSSNPNSSYRVKREELRIIVHINLRSFQSEHNFD